MKFVPTQLQAAAISADAQEILISAEYPACGRTTALIMGAHLQPGSVLLETTYPRMRVLRDAVADFRHNTLAAGDAPVVACLEELYLLRGLPATWVGIDDIQYLETPDLYLRALAQFHGARFFSTVLSRHAPAWVYERWPHLRPVMKLELGSNPYVPDDFYRRFFKQVTGQTLPAKVSHD